MTHYKHTQIGYMTASALGAGTLMLAGMASQIGLRPLLPGFAVLGISAPLLATMTIEIADGELRAKFGPLLVKKVKWDDIASCRAVVNNWTHGWGIHISPDGWVYNVSGYGAVEIVLKNGAKFRLGTDEPDALTAAVNERTGRP